ncbi:MAG: 3',5'-cyclic-nucleotide phosphodiesterase [Gemmataceae bacterium]|nr:3',5'-cyclic-nucleotide phosphodiesterase [Gemmataceae bacterium]
MRIRVLPSALGGGVGQPLSSFVVDDCLALDAGALGLYGRIDEQARITDIILTHSHIDHVAGLPVLVDNVYDPKPGCVRVYGTEATLTSLQEDIFNGRLYPDMIAMSKRLPPFLELRELPVRKPVKIAGYTVTAIPVNHVVPTVALIVDDGSVAVALVTDTAPTDEIWEVVGRHPRIRGIFLECSFPREHLGVAKAAMHLNSDLFAAELTKLPPRVPVYVIHIKPRFADQIIHELIELRDKRINVAVPGMTYTFRKKAEKAKK